jgi:uroporphyrinogen-III synthase
MSAREREAMSALDGRTIALLENRRGAELDALVRHAGGTPVRAVSVLEVERPGDVARLADGLDHRRFDVVVFQTGAGVQALLNHAEHRGRVDASVAALRRCTVACRGPKPLAVLKRHGITPHVTTAKPHTSDELIDGLARLNLDRRTVALVHYGEQNRSLSAALGARGARVDDICAYEWTLPEDPGPLVALMERVIDGRVDALLVTSQIQYRNLCEVAERADRERLLKLALQTEVIVGAIGPVCADAIRRTGVMPDVMPAAPNLPSLVRALSDYFELIG